MPLGPKTTCTHMHVPPYTHHTSIIKNKINVFLKNLANWHVQDMTGVWCVHDFLKYSGESHITKLENTTLSSMVTSRAPLLSLEHSRPDRWSVLLLFLWVLLFPSHKLITSRAYINVSKIPRKVIYWWVTQRWVLERITKGCPFFPFVPPPLDQLEKKWLLNSTKPHTFFSYWVTY